MSKVLRRLTRVVSYKVELGGGMAPKSYSPEYLELLKDRQELINRYPHLKVLHYQIHNMEDQPEKDSVQVAMEINLLLVSHLRPDLHPEVDEFIKKFKSKYFLNIDRPIQTRALYPAHPGPISKKVNES